MPLSEEIVAEALWLWHQRRQHELLALASLNREIAAALAGKKPDAKTIAELRARGRGPSWSQGEPTLMSLALSERRLGPAVPGRPCSHSLLRASPARRAGVAACPPSPSPALRLKPPKQAAWPGLAETPKAHTMRTLLYAAPIAALLAAGAIGLTGTSESPLLWPAARAGAGQKWVTAWTASMQGPYPRGFALLQPDLSLLFPDPARGAKAQSFRMIVHPDLWGNRARIRLSNAFG